MQNGWSSPFRSPFRVEESLHRVNHRTLSGRSCCWQAGRRSTLQVHVAWSVPCLNFCRVLHRVSHCARSGRSCCWQASCRSTVQVHVEWSIPCLKICGVLYDVHHRTCKWKVFLLASRSPIESTGTRVASLPNCVIYTQLKKRSAGRNGTENGNNKMEWRIILL